MTTSSEPRPYAIVRLLGSGGMAQVFEAVAEGAGGFRRRVALKRILPDHQADESVRRSFFDEARIVSHLHHGGIVGVLDYGIAEGVPFQILELVDGTDARSLAESGRKKGNPITAGLALHVCREIAHALHYAHEARGEDGHALGLVHRDVKPANILVSWSGDVKLGDFGIAFASVRTEQTIDGTAKGTPPYMSPEQSRGDDLDARADVFSLGCALHALLCGKSPLAGQAALRSVLRGEDAPLHPDLPEDVRDIVARATRTDREQRYRTAAEMAEALGRAAARRLEHDPKTELIAWIAAVRPEPRQEPPPARAAGRLDALLGAELLVVGEAHEGTFRRPETQRAPLAPEEATREEGRPRPPTDATSPAHAAPAPAAWLTVVSAVAPPSDACSQPPLPADADSTSPAGADSPSPADADSTSPAGTDSPSPAARLEPPRRRRALLFGLGAALVLALGVMSWVRFGPATPGVSAAATAHDPGADILPRAAATTQSTGTSPAPADAPTLTIAPGTAAISLRDTGARPAPGPGSAHAMSSNNTPSPGAPTGIPSGAPGTAAVPSQTATPAPPADAPAATDIALTGTLAVGGPVGATVLVDGAPRGLTPKYIPLSLGAHRVEVVSSDGARLGATVVTIKPEHTASAPLRWSPPKPR